MRIGSLFDRSQLAAYLETGPFDPSRLEGDGEYDAEEAKDMRRDDIRQSARDLLLVERAREWLIEKEA